VASGVGNTISKSPEVEVLSPPKSKTTTVGSPDAVSLYIKAPRAVIVAEVNVKLAKSVRPVVPEEVGVTLVNAPPPAEYVPLLPTSFVAVYAVVAAVKEALFVYKASLNVLPEEFVKLCVAVINSFLNEVHMKLPVKAILKSP
tara:strand:- start:1328 stop:1756 length:429 start_codon:yes stop_codon:yes gene_type:complete